MTPEPPTDARGALTIINLARLKEIIGEIDSVWRYYWEADRSSRHDHISGQRGKAKRAVEEKEAAE